MFIKNSDFNAFDKKFATSNYDRIIRARQFVVDNCMKYLHYDEGIGEGLGDFFKKYGLYQHWQKQHLTNVYCPLSVVNGGWLIT
jgi:hypothetical protein